MQLSVLVRQRSIHAACGSKVGPKVIATVGVDQMIAANSIDTS